MLRSSSAGKSSALAKTLDDNNNDYDEEKLTGRLLGAADPTVVTKNHQRRNHATIIQVIAPSNLEAGYQFTVQLEGKSYLVEVPDGGVVKGQTFNATVMECPLVAATVVIPNDDVLAVAEEEDDNPHHIPTGRWRDGCAECCYRPGLCHVTMWLACCCQPLLLGQIMTRLGLDPWARSQPLRVRNNNNNNTTSAFQVMAVVFASFLVLNHVLSSVIVGYTAGRGEVEELGVALCVMARAALRLCFLAYVWFCLWRTRALIRERYRIPPSCANSGECGETVEDAVCAYCFACCITAQMARHTADYETYHATCCSETGLSPRAPAIV